MEPGQWARTVTPNKKENVVRSPTCKLNNLTRKPLKQKCMNSQLKPPKCYIKITGSRYNGTFLLNIDKDLDDAIYHTMRDVEVALEAQTDPMGKPRVSPKNCLSSVFRCFGTSDLQAKAVCNKRKPPKPVNKPAEYSLSATINKSNLGPLISAVQSSSFAPTRSPENSSECVMRDIVDTFRTTLDQFCKEKLRASSKLLVDTNHPEHSAPISISNTEIIEEAKQSREELEKVSFIKFSQEEVLVIQPPTPSNNNANELEVGIEVKPKITASNVGQSIKLSKDKVLIGVQDGKGVLQINDGVPKRSLQMVIEEGVNGKPSMKLSVKEENSEFNELLMPKQNHDNKVMSLENKEESPHNCINSHFNESASTMTNPNGTHGIHNNLKQYKSVESQVSRVHLVDINLHAREKQKYKSESTQYQNSTSSDQYPNGSHYGCCTTGMKTMKTVGTAPNENGDVSQGTFLSSLGLKRSSVTPEAGNFRFNRMPYLVHTLYEPRSLQNSSAYFASNNPSRYRSFVKAPTSKKPEMSNRQIKKPKSFIFSSDYSSSSKCTRIFRDIKEMGVTQETGVIRKDVEPIIKKDASLTKALIEDFETILQNMCGSSYLYHNPKTSESKPVTAKNHLLDNLSFDQWTQTDCCNQEAQICLETATKKHRPKDKTTKRRDSGDGSHSRTLRKKARRSIASQRKDESSISTSGLENALASDSSEGSKHKIVFSMVAASNENPLERSSKSWIPDQAKSSVGQKIFAAIKDQTSPSTLLGDVDSNDSFIFPACEDTGVALLQGGNNISVVNMALYDPCGPQWADTPEGEAPTEVKTMDDVTGTMSQYNGMIKPKLDEQWNHNSEFHATTSQRSSYPIRVKSKSCQNLSVTPCGSQPSEKLERGIIPSSKIKKLRYHHLTASDSRSISALNACGILNFKERNMKGDDQPLVNFEKNKPISGQALPSAIRSLLLPNQPPFALNNGEPIPTYWRDNWGTMNADYSDFRDSQNENEWWTSNESFDSTRQVAMRRNLFKRTFFAMKTVRTIVTRKVFTLFHKLSFTHSEKKKTDLAITDSLVYVAIPLEKKRENLHLYPSTIKSGINSYQLSYVMAIIFQKM